jgi:hypothetical protein
MGITYHGNGATAAARERQAHPADEARYQATLAEHRGELIKPPLCEHCGKPKKKLEKHHDDHSRADVVNFVCPDCHRIAETKKKIMKSDRDGK